MQKMKKTIEGTGTDLFICFTSRPSAATASVTAAAAAMRVPSSKSLTSPGRSSAPTPSLSSSLSRRLRSSGSLKSAGAQSPMFPSVAGSRKKGCAFEAAEPSSPKVTCIGQVRVKSKKKKMKNAVSRSRSVRSGAESSFRRSHESRRTKAVSICDAFSCFVPCCSSSETTKREKRGRSSPSCGAVFARWLMAIQEDEEEEVKANEYVREFVAREREVEIDLFEKKVEEEEEEVVVVVEEELEEVEVMEEEEKARVSVCVPPRNALLLMRCRSDPVRMAELATRFWDSPAMRVDCQQDAQIVENDGEFVDECNVDEVEVRKVVMDEKKLEQQVVVVIEEEKIVVAEEVAEEEVEKEMLGEVILGEEVTEEVKDENESSNVVVDTAAKEEQGIVVERGKELEIVLRRSISCSAAKSNELSKVKRRSFSYREKKEKRRHSFSVEMEGRRRSFCSEKEARRSSFSVEKESKGRWSFSVEKENMGPKSKEKAKPPVAHCRVQAKEEDMPAALAEPVKAIEPKVVVKESKDQVVSKTEEARLQGVERGKKGGELPDCLLLMMYEPKLSMEVSKETWVCSNDFLHWRPNYTAQTNQLSKSNAGNGHKPEEGEEEQKLVENKNVTATAITTENSEAIAPATPTKPSAEPKKAQKSSAVGLLQQSPYEHFVLTRCKSEPVKSSARLLPDAWFWKARHQPISTAGVGF